MKNKGFTLIELLIVVAILSIIGVLVTVNLSSTMEDTNQKQCDEFVNEIENAACAYVGMSDKKIICTRTICNPIKIQVLVEEGFIKSEVDACTGDSINLNETVSVSWNSNGEKKCKYNGVITYER